MRKNSCRQNGAESEVPCAAGTAIRDEWRGQPAEPVPRRPAGQWLALDRPRRGCIRVAPLRPMQSRRPMGAACSIARILSIHNWARFLSEAALILCSLGGSRAAPRAAAQGEARSAQPVKRGNH